MVIDFHAHVFPDALAARALSSIAEQSGGLAPVTDGTLTDTLAKGRLWGVDRFVFLNIATNPRQQAKVNDFAIALTNAGHYAFGSLHPDADDIEEETARLQRAGVAGLKLHPHYQGFMPDDLRMARVYEAAIRHGLPVLFHSGQDIAYPADETAAPRRLAAVVKAYPKLTVIAAHMGGWKSACEVLTHLAGLPLYFDTSFAKGHINPEEGRALVRAHGADRFLFGTDSPWMDGFSALAFLDGLALTEGERDKILYQNALRLLEGES